MNFYELVFLSVALSMDAFAVSVCKGFSVRGLNTGKTITVGLYFGVFQALMPLTGYLLASIFSEQIQAFDHWIAFVLLVGIGMKMLIDALRNDLSCPVENSGSVRFLVMLPLAVATSIDALAAGVTLSFLQVNILGAVLLIGAITFCLSIIGVKIGHAFGMKYQKRAEITGGVILILLGAKILLDHLELW
ncbi:MAG: hypothetical protein CVU97_06870 [Firmicutes bacterium HGW-Firmicutes-21]|nr:MAG: hypothetical protein CVU97_06870 [Firmicutes bacterium HGW-Firmicutes-21]